MTMIVANKGSRRSVLQITICKKYKRINFSKEFFLKNNINKENARFVRLGFDKANQQIGIEFSVDGKTESVKLTYAPTGSSGSCTVSPITSTFAIDINKIAGTYSGKSIKGPQKIEGFSENCFVLNLLLRKK